MRISKELENFCSFFSSFHITRICAEGSSRPTDAMEEIISRFVWCLLTADLSECRCATLTRANRTKRFDLRYKVLCCWDAPTHFVCRSTRRGWSRFTTSLDVEIHASQRQAECSFAHRSAEFCTWFREKESIVQHESAQRNVPFCDVQALQCADRVICCVPPAFKPVSHCWVKPKRVLKYRNMQTAIQLDGCFRLSENIYRHQKIFFRDHASNKKGLGIYWRCAQKVSLCL